MTKSVLREKIHDIIDEIPDDSLPALRPLLTHLAEDYWKPVIEPASPEEIAICDERMRDYQTNPEAWTSIDDI
ncbi:MAG: hypothetical protein FWE09_08540 [Treponema sp.]|nr:hypothetical protein [Treponema sp.]